MVPLPYFNSLLDSYCLWEMKTPCLPHSPSRHSLPILQTLLPLFTVKASALFVFLPAPYDRVQKHGKTLYSFPLNAATNHDELSDIKQQKFIFSQFWKLEVQNQDHWAGIKDSS